MADLSLTIAATPGPATAALLAGQVSIPGIAAEITAMHPSELFWRQLHHAEFDVSELSLASLLIAISKGDQTWTPLPVFTSRRFFHTEIMVRRDAGIEEPADLAGKCVGVPEYQQTAAVWARMALLREFGVGAADVTWFMERSAEKSHGSATGFTPPPGVQISTIPPDTSIGEMLEAGELDAALHYIAASNAIDRSKYSHDSVPGTRLLFADPAAEARRYYAKTGLLPMNHCVVIRTALAAKHDYLAHVIAGAFTRSKEMAISAARRLYAPALAKGLAEPALFDMDPLPFGLAAQELRSVQALADHLANEGLTGRPLPAAAIFARPDAV